MGFYLDKKSISKDIDKLRIHKDTRAGTYLLVKLS